MGLREKMNRQPVVVGVIVCIAVGIAGWIVFNATSSIRGPQIPKRAFFTTDDGKTWFADDINRVPPFKTADGKDAVRAYVFSCQGGKAPFVMYLSRYTEVGKKKTEELMAQSERAMVGGPPPLIEEQQVKKPGKTEWISETDHAKATQVTAIECPPGQEELVAIEP